MRDGAPAREQEAADPDAPSAESGLGRLTATVARLREQVRRAHADADGRALLEMATGVLVERLHCGPSHAARQLTDLAESAGVPPLELAADIIDQAAQDRLSQTAREFLTRLGTETADGLAARPGTGMPGAGQGGDGPGAAVATPALRLRTAESRVLAADDCQTVAESILEHALAPLGATAVAIWATGPGASLRLVGHAGLPAEEAGLWHYVPPGVISPAIQAMTARRPVWIDSLSEAGVPSIGHRSFPDGGRVAAPAEIAGRIHGVLEICWPDRVEPQPPPIHRQVEALAELVAHTIETVPADSYGGTPATREAPDTTELIDLVDALHDPVLLLLPHLDSAGRLVDFRIHHANSGFADPGGRPRSLITGALLLEAYPEMADDNGLFDAVSRVHATGEPFRDAAMPLTTVVGQVRVPTRCDVGITRHGNAVVLVWRVEDETARLANLLQHAQRLGRIGGFEEDHVTGHITWNSQLYDLYDLPRTTAPLPLDQLPAHTHPDDTAAVGRFLRSVVHHRRPTSAAFRLQRPDGVTRYVRLVAEPVVDADQRLVAVRGAYQDVSAQHWTEVALAVTQDQLAHSEQQTAARNRLAKQLQHAIMPPAHEGVDAPDLDVAVRYRPAEDEHLVGGDWYDAVVLPTRQVLLSVGDVAGHGIDAATGMVALRNALRGLAATGAGPAQILTWLNVVAHHLTKNVTATAVCALYDPPTRTLTWARAGHLPPVHIRDGRAAQVPLANGLLLGAIGEADYEEQQLVLEPGDILLMYTDGLIERRDRSLQESLDQLVATAAHASETLDQRLDHLLTHSTSDTDDDTCIVGIQLPLAARALAVPTAG
nr:SpoIIE family protein phosphatase [Streptomyces sp. SN-593]